MNCWVVYSSVSSLHCMRTTRILRTWDKIRGDFVKIPVQYPPDTTLSCGECRYNDSETGQCNGVGSLQYRRKIPYPSYVPRIRECTVRLPPDLLSYVWISKKNRVVQRCQIGEEETDQSGFNSGSKTPMKWPVEFVMLKKTRRIVVVHILDVQERATVAIVYNIIGSIVNFLDAYFLQKLREHMIDR